MVKVPGQSAAPEEIQSFRRAVGVPEEAGAYQVKLNHTLLENDPEINEKLHKAGFTNEQVQLVYDLAAERVFPLIEEMSGDFDALQQLEKLYYHFGGKERFDEISRQIQAFEKRT